MLPDSFETNRLILRPIAADDASPIFTSYAQDSEVVRFLIWYPHHSMADTEDYIARCMAAPADRERTYAVLGRPDGALLGAFALRRGESYRLDCGYVLARPFWGRGLMTEALAEVAQWAMQQDGIWRIGAYCDVENRASARVMEKAGLQREGILRRWIVHPNVSAEPRDCFSYAMVR
jgi:RimJ/RimL family protein N-acetyltransferase